MARRHLVEHGAAALSLRAVARDVGMVSSAVYRYVASRDELLTRLIIDAYDSLGTAVEATEHTPPRGDVRQRFVRAATAVRNWALDHPHEYALVYGSPVPGYAAPEDTIDPAARVPMVLLRILTDGVASGELGADRRTRVGPAVRADLAQLRQNAPGVPDSVLLRGMAAWTQLFGHISFELFGHFHNVITDTDAFFDLEMRRLADYLVDGPSAAPR